MGPPTFIQSPGFPRPRVTLLNPMGVPVNWPLGVFPVGNGDDRSLSSYLLGVSLSSPPRSVAPLFSSPLNYFTTGLPAYSVSFWCKRGSPFIESHRIECHSLRLTVLVVPQGVTVSG